MHIFLTFKFKQSLSLKAISAESIKGEERAMFQFSFTSVTAVSYLTENLFQFSSVSCTLLCPSALFQSK